jgi:hypothetical protein
VAPKFGFIGQASEEAAVTVFEHFRRKKWISGCERRPDFRSLPTETEVQSAQPETGWYDFAISRILRVFLFFVVLVLKQCEVRE